ncbi:hypothetical protein MHYP_G00238240 [Metynnis hypsauchen]
MNPLSMARTVLTEKCVLSLIAEEAEVRMFLELSLRWVECEELKVLSGGGQEGLLSDCQCTAKCYSSCGPLSDSMLSPSRPIQKDSIHREDMMDGRKFQVTKTLQELVLLPPSFM